MLNPKMKRESTITILALLVIVGSVGSLVHRFTTSQHSPEMEFAEYIGKQLGEKAVSLAGDLPRVLLVIPDDMSADSSGIRPYLDGIRRAIKHKSPNVEFVMGTTRYDPFAAQEGGDSVHPDDFVELLEKNTGCTVVISLIGLPGLSSAVTDAWQIRRPVFIAFVPVAPSLDAWFAAGMLQAVLVARSSDAPPPTAEADSLANRFQRDFEFLMP